MNNYACDMLLDLFFFFGTIGIGAVVGFCFTMAYMSSEYEKLEKKYKKVKSESKAS
jgi:hypothetical protein